MDKHEALVEELGDKVGEFEDMIKDLDIEIGEYGEDGLEKSPHLHLFQKLQTASNVQKIIIENVLYETRVEKLIRLKDILGL